MESLTLSAGCVTGVGSLPFRESREAIEFVSRHSGTLPFWPQLPRRDLAEEMIAQVIAPLLPYLDRIEKPSCWSLRPGCEAIVEHAMRCNDAALIPEAAQGFTEFERWLKAGQFPQARAFKGQLVGPVTLASCLSSAGRPLVQHPGWLEIVTDFLIRHAIWQIRRLQIAGKPVLMVVDEPALHCPVVEETASTEARMQSVGMRNSLNRLLRAIKNAGAIPGLHCCAPLAIPFLRELSLDYLSFDAHLVGTDIVGTDGGLIELARQILQRGGWLAFGLVSTTQVAEREAASRLTSNWFDLASKIGDVASVARRSLVTATCGLGHSTPETTLAAFRTAQQIGENILNFSKLNE
jgi:hypothetical protein